MSQQNTNKMTPKPNIRPSAQNKPGVRMPKVDDIIDLAIEALQSENRAHAEETLYTVDIPNCAGPIEVRRSLHGITYHGSDDDLRRIGLVQTGPTTRLEQPRCPACSDILPPGDPKFCIECGHALPRG